MRGVDLAVGPPSGWLEDVEERKLHESSWQSQGWPANLKQRYASETAVNSAHRQRVLTSLNQRRIAACVLRGPAIETHFDEDVEEALGWKIHSGRLLSHVSRRTALAGSTRWIIRIVRVRSTGRFHERDAAPGEHHRDDLGIDDHVTIARIMRNAALDLR